MRIGWLADAGNADGTMGGAELTAQEFRVCAPPGVEIVDCPPGGVVPGLDKFVVHNCVTYTPEDIWAIGDAPVVRYLHDVWPHGDLTVKAHLLKHATLICCSPVQQLHMGLNGDSHLIPPPVDLEPFRRAAESAVDRKGAVALGPWMNYDKGAHRAVEACPDVEFFGGGPCAPVGSVQVAYDQMPEILARYATFVHLPTAIEPFGRTVVEAWATGCRVITNHLVGARYWIEKQPARLESAAEDFWDLVTA